MTLEYWKGRHVVYRFFEGDRLLYVGRTTNLGHRVTEHRKTWWFGFVTRTRLQVFRTADAADAAERQAIRSEAPAFNQMGTGRAWDSRHNWTPLDHQRHDAHMTRVWSALGKPYPRAAA